MVSPSTRQKAKVPIVTTKPPEKPADESPGRQPIPPAMRRRLQMCFEHGSKSAAKSDFDYATDMFQSCVAGDPGNPIYIGQFLNNLVKKYNDNKKGAGFTSAPKIKLLQGSLKKSAYSKDWVSIIKTGLDILKLNPWETSTLVAMADACDALKLDESELVYLKQALNVDAKDAEINRKCGRAWRGAASSTRPSPVGTGWNRPSRGTKRRRAPSPTWRLKRRSATAVTRGPEPRPT